jgi:hypothetical protein
VRYILVLQWPGDSEPDFDALLSLEDRIGAALGRYASVDGHDFGSGEINIFIQTDRPVEALPMRPESYVGVQDGVSCGLPTERRGVARTRFSGREASKISRSSERLLLMSISSTRKVLEIVARTA